MAQLTIVNADSREVSYEADLIFTDPMFDLDGKDLAEIVSKQKSNHLVMITTMKQLLAFDKASDFELAFDFVIDAVVPKKSKADHQPNYTHQTGVYFKRPGAKSIFNRKLRQRSDTFDNNGYWPSVLRAPRERMQEHGMSKNLTAMTDLLGSFKAKTVLDLFAGSGTTALASFELDLDCIVVEKDKALCDSLAKTFKFLGNKVNYLAA